MPSSPARVLSNPHRSDAHLVEVSWEVCHQVGGIYQVLRSKAKAMQQVWGDRYVLLGPYLPGIAEIELEPEPAADGWAEVLADVASTGHRIQHGRWLVAGHPRAVLVDPMLPPDRIEVLRHRLHRDHGIPPARGNELVDRVLGFGDGVHAVLASAARHAGGRPLLAHFHEWLSAASLPVLRRAGLPIATVFTTHATLVGRYSAGSTENLHDKLVGLDGDDEARRFGIETEHSIERVAATECDVFTTVSPITGEECTQFLRRTPDLVTPNGLDLERFDLGHDFQTHHAQHKDQIHRFTMGHFFPSYGFDLDDTLYLFNSGRFEPRNKGFDLCLESMARLNAELRAQGSTTTVVFFIITARQARSLEPRALHSRGVLDDLDEVSGRIGHDVGERLFRSSAAGGSPSLDDLVEDYWRLRHRRLQHAFASKELPLVCTHVLPDRDSDPVLAHLEHLGLRNTAADRVKVVYHPDFINPTNPLWGMDYEHFVRGCHLGVFPSCYEPWGYTPLECLAMGVPAITSDLSGFGRYTQEAFPDHDAWGLQVLPRRGRGYHDAAADLAERILAFCRLDRPGRISLRNQVALHAWAFDWSALAHAYHAAHGLALTERFGE